MPPSSSDPCLFRRRRKDARPAELLDAALTLFVEKGFAATRSEEVARAAGVSKGTLYLYFPSKEELLKAVIQHFLGSEIDAGIEAAAALEGPTADVMEQLMVTWWERVYEGPASAVFKLVVTEGRNFPEIAQFYVERVVDPGNALVARLLQRGIERGEFEQVDIEHTVGSIIMPMILMCVHKHSLAECTLSGALADDPMGFVRAHMRLIFNGLRSASARTALSTAELARRPA